ncbi:MAG: c-type cytochrome biogenesis protein CcsB [Armatimonadota bacterium]
MFLRLGEIVLLNYMIMVATLVAYMVAAVMYMWALLGERRFAYRVAHILSILGIVVQGIGMVIEAITVHRMPFDNSSRSLMFVAWALMLIFVLIERKYKITGLGWFASLIAAIAVASAWMLPGNVSSSIPTALQNRWSAIHIASCLIAYSCLVLAFGAALTYLFQEGMLKAKRINMFQRHIPSLDAADKISYRMVALGFPMLTLGVITGSLWAQSAWGSYWSWDPKETWSFATWLIYAVYLHVRVISGRRGRWPNMLLVAGFCCIVITFMGVNFVSKGLHSGY